MDLKNKEYLKKNELAKITGVRPSTIKWYSEIGILPYEQKEFKLHRIYKKDSSIKRLKEIKALKRKGDSIKQITEAFQK